VSSDYLLAVKSIGLSKLAGRKPCTLSSAARHNKRELAPELEARGRIDGDKSELNYCLVGATDSSGVLATALRLMAEIGTHPDKMRRDYCQAVEILFSLHPTTTIDTRQYFAACVAWCCDRFGAVNVLSADVHHDEAAPHCHALIAPLQDGRWLGGKLIDHAHTKAMRESFGRQVAGVYGLRMVDKLTGGRKADAVALVLADIERNHPGLIGSTLWQPLRQAIERNPDPFIVSMGLVLADKPPTKRRTMAEIFTSVGKGAKRETLHLPKPNPVGIETRAKHANPLGIDGKMRLRKPAPANPVAIENAMESRRTLSCVGIAFPKHANRLKKEASAPNAEVEGRTVEKDFDTPHGDWMDFDQSGVDQSTRAIEVDGVVRVRDVLPDFSVLDTVFDGWAGTE
jgi:Plasmid recombination enzyme